MKIWEISLIFFEWYQQKKDIATAREKLRKTYTGKSPKADISQTEIAQILSALISFKLESTSLNESQRIEMQEEHEAVCSEL